MSEEDAAGGYQLTNTAEGELLRILEGIADKDGITRALHVHGKFLRAFENIGSRQRIGTKRPSLTGEHVLWWPVFNWIVLYDPGTSPSSILRVLHGARDLNTILQTDDFDLGEEE